MTSSFPWQPATFLAPMEGVTTPPVRELMVQRGGIGVVCTEFVRVTSQPMSSRTLAKHVVRPSQGVLSVQVMGNDLTQMAEAAALVTDAGAEIVDINLGCPAPRAVRKGVGSAMLRDPALVHRVLAAMRQRTSLPLSAKIRAGFEDSSQVLEVARAIQEAGVDFLTVHPRRRVDFYRGVADWRIIARLAETLSIPVVGNGDIWYAADALRIERETGCVAVMIGRPALRNPWIFRQVEELRAGRTPFAPSGADVTRHVEELERALRTFLPDRNVAGMLKEQFRYLGRAVRDQGSLVREVCRLPDASAIVERVRTRFEGLSAADLDLGAEGGDVERSGRALAADQAELGEPMPNPGALVGSTRNCSGDLVSPGPALV